MSATIQHIKEELVASARRAYQIGLQVGNGGNFSGRVPGVNLIIIKPSGYSFGQCTADDLVTVNLQGELVDGSGSPSRELPTHLAIYKQSPDVHGVFHSHSPWSIACASYFDAIPTETFHAKSKLGKIPVLSMPNESTQELLGEVEILLTANPGLSAFVQARHGIFSLAKTITLAEHNAELVEETSQVALLMAILSNARPRHKEEPVTE